MIPEFSNYHKESDLLFGKRDGCCRIAPLTHVPWKESRIFCLFFKLSLLCWWHFAKQHSISRIHIMIKVPLPSMTKPSRLWPIDKTSKASFWSDTLPLVPVYDLTAFLIKPSSWSFNKLCENIGASGDCFGKIILVNFLLMSWG